MGKVSVAMVSLCLNAARFLYAMFTEYTHFAV